MSNQPGIETLLQISPVLPVVTIDDADHAVALATALLRGGIGSAEITLRTPAALAAIEAIARALPEFSVAAGTVLTPEDLAAAASAGARFAVSPGATPVLLDAGRNATIAYLPAIATASELMTGVERGYRCFKFFPATAAGGVATLAAFAGPFAALRFCPTGGIDAANAADFLRLGNVLCVGGSWIAPRTEIAAGAWAAIEQRARESMTLRGRMP